MFALSLPLTWAAWHPAISHFPIAFLCLAPVLIAVALGNPAQRRVLVGVAFWVLVAGTVGIYLSAMAGDAAREVAPKTPEVVKAIEAHEHLGEIIRAVFTALALLLGILHYGPRFLKKELSGRVFGLCAGAFLLLNLAATLVLANAAHTGGVLVHRLGVHAKL